MRKYLQDYCILFLILSVNINFAQLEAHEIDGEGWAKGNLVEIGINSAGVYGANTLNKPISFHNNREAQNNLFGFIANPLNDGWLDYDGDFFVSGDPEESFGIQINGKNYNNFNTFFNNKQEIPGAINSVNIVKSACFEDTSQIVWEGNVEGINVKRFFSITEDGLFIQMVTYLKNRSSETKQNVFFMHNVDPDNNAAISNVFHTNMNLISQASSASDNICLVTASQQPLGTPLDMDGSFVSFYAKNENARVSYGGFANRDAQDIWFGNNVTNTENSVTPFIDKAISIAFNLGDIEPNATRKFTYYYVLKEIDEVFEPLIVNIFSKDPSSCSGNDGEIILSGLDVGESYVINYFKDGIFIPNQNYTANLNGEIEIKNLSSGNFNNIFISYSGCNTLIDTEINLKEPVPSNFTLSKEDLTNCFNIDGVITIKDLVSFTIYNFSYMYNDTLVQLNNLNANSDGEIVISNLDEGTYSDFILEQYNCFTSSNEIIEINRPEESSVTFSTNASFFPEENTIEIFPSISGSYLYNIDDGPFQSSSIFTNVPSGNHTFSVTDVYGCEVGRFEKAIVQYMKVFTPNNDGVNDYWQIIGIQQLKDPKVYIYNRYGKLIKQLSKNSLGWDGTFNGSLLSTNDYWFKIIYKDDQNNNQEFISHFSLKL